MNINKFPYTDFHEMNMDWILEEIKNTIAAWNAKKAELEELQADLQGYADRLASLESALNTMSTTTIPGINSRIGAVEGRVDDAENDIDELQEDLTDIRENFKLEITEDPLDPSIHIYDAQVVGSDIATLKTNSGNYELHVTPSGVNVTKTVGSSTISYDLATTLRYYNNFSGGAMINAPVIRVTDGTDTFDLMAKLRQI